MKFRFLKDFPPTAWKKGDVYDENRIEPENGYLPFPGEFTIALMLHTGVIEEVKEKQFICTCIVCNKRMNEEEWRVHGCGVEPKEEAEAKLEAIKKVLLG